MENRKKGNGVDGCETMMGNEYHYWYLCKSENGKIENGEDGEEWLDWAICNEKHITLNKKWISKGACDTFTLYVFCYMFFIQYQPAKAESISNEKHITLNKKWISKINNGWLHTWHKWATSWVGRTGFEPVTSCVWSKRSKPTELTSHTWQR